MVLKTFDIDWTDGTKKTIQYEDDIPMEKFSPILTKTVDVTNMVSGQIKIDIPNYISLILQNTIVNAPFNPNPQELGKLGKKLYGKITNNILASYPLGESLEPWATAMLGDTEQKKSLIESMPSVQANSGGTNAQLIVNQ